MRIFVDRSGLVVGVGGIFGWGGVSKVGGSWRRAFEGVNSSDLAAHAFYSCRTKPGL